ncbi:RNA-directed DNA polymerase [Desulfamplus magnetovallimortis]|uniref:RNA-directed DNA polymerase n=1 Tax=Desulfamplus magnetovallimortis TaxID=1246637 RepID=A0A1W1H8J3_9BACT|nr:group II intron reverse transcriptase/maturase [Desulfamplus magnetovallimortis]SLM28791.1 RNA-directed DNA polymerase [Desulfamplus magnetovallimortis]
MMTVIAIDGLKNFDFAWKSINWEAMQNNVNRLQARIVKAVKEGNKEKVRSLQRLLSMSFAAKLLAVKRVSENKGKRTPGVDNRLLDSAKKKLHQVLTLNRAGYHSQPLKRVYIPKKNGKKRPLGIPVMKDRSEQALELQGLDPVSECTADCHSYGFRKMRSTQDATSAIYNALRRKGSANYILEGDIKSCFDCISHEWMLDNIPMHKQKLKIWLKSGYLERGIFHPTKEGTPQGGIISPVLANMVLDGMEDLLKHSFRKQDKIHMVRYADDFVITGSSKELLQYAVKPLLVRFLKERGLSLSAEKTLITHIDEGFDFLGFNFRKYKGKLLIKPAKSSIARIKEKIRTIIKSNKTGTTDNLILALNPIIRGWANYYRHVVSSEVFGKIDHAIWHTTWRWSRRRHPNKSSRWIKNKYFQQEGDRDWVFGEKESSERLLRMGQIHIRRHIKIKADANPYDPLWDDYFAKRSKPKAAGFLNELYQCLSPVR